MTDLTLGGREPKHNKGRQRQSNALHLSELVSYSLLVAAANGLKLGATTRACAPRIKINEADDISLPVRSSIVALRRQEIPFLTLCPPIQQKLRTARFSQAQALRAVSGACKLPQTWLRTTPRPLSPRAKTAIYYAAPTPQKCT